MKALTIPQTQDRLWLAIEAQHLLVQDRWRLVEALQRTLERTIQVTRDAERVLRTARPRWNSARSALALPCPTPAVSGARPPTSRA